MFTPQLLPDHTPARRNRWILGGIATLVGALGWSARIHAAFLPPLVGSYAPDTLWALLVFLVVLIARPDLRASNAVGIALLIAYGVECSQLLQFSWLQNIRATRLGGLLLGHGFLWSDLACYAAGIGLAAGADARSFALDPQRKRKSEHPRSV